MVEVVSTFLGVKDTTGVTLEVVVGSINRDASWSGLNGGFKGGDAPGLDGFVGNSVDNSIAGFGFATLGLCNVWISFLELDGGFLGIVESIDFETSIASI
jgi:hypothetical protein